MHYMFQSETKVRNFLQNCTNKLVKGGYLVLSHPDANVIVRKLRDDQASYFDENLKCWVIDNKYYSIVCDRKDFKKADGWTGLVYGYFLTDNLVGFMTEKDGKEHMHYVPEYFVITSELVKIAKEYGLELEETKNFHDFWAEEIKYGENRDLFTKRMKFDFDTKDEYIFKDKDLWDCSYIYRVLVFKKVKGDKEMKDVDRKIFKPKSYYKTFLQQ